mgnify:CR=1 FL=1
MAMKPVQRRLSTILTADLVGYVILLCDDGTRPVEEVRAIVDELVKPKAAQYSGRIVKLMGNSVLMEFASVNDAV